MEAKATRERLVLAVLVVLLGVVLWWRFGGGEGPSPAFERPRTVPAVRGSRDAAPAVVEPVALAELQVPAPKPAETGRNPFRFQAKALPPSSDEARGPADP